jgi:hypothetical protein
MSTDEFKHTFVGGGVFNAPYDQAGTQIRLPAEIQWSSPAGAPKRSFESAMLWGALDAVGPYMTLVRWWPGWMSAPHTYLTDRLCIVLSGVWLVAHGEQFDPTGAVSVPAGGFIRRDAGSPHYDGVAAAANEPCVVAISGLAPIGLQFCESGSPIRKL